MIMGAAEIIFLALVGLVFGWPAALGLFIVCFVLFEVL